MSLSTAQLVEFIAQRLAGPTSPLRSLATAPAADLVLAAACTAQEPTAHTAFDAVLGEVAGASTRSPQDLIDDVKQLLRVQLLVPRSKPPGIAGYRGKGPLRGWVRITATRELIRHLRKRERKTPSERPLDEVLADANDPLLSPAQGRVPHRVRHGAARGDRRARRRGPHATVPQRQQSSTSCRSTRSGAAFGVHRAIAARWLQRARGALLTATRGRLLPGSGSPSTRSTA